MLDSQGEASLEETHPVCRRVGRRSLTPGCDILRPQLHAQSGPTAVRLAPATNGSESREKVGEGAGRLPGIWKLKFNQVRVSCGVQFNAEISRCRKGIDIVDVDVGALSF